MRRSGAIVIATPLVVAGPRDYEIHTDQSGVSAEAVV
jgi:hypothetical protein